MEIIVQGKGPIKLTEKDYITSGGEGKIYCKGSTIYKIFESPDKMIPVEKMKELSQLDQYTNILRPKELILDKKQRAIGFTMDRVDDSIPICKLFTNDYRNRNGITPELTIKLIETMQEVIQYIHDNNIVQVDGNELNYLVDVQTHLQPYFIDVNSYQTPNFPATAIMPSIRDYSTKDFSTLTDWWSFAIIACQLMVGIHPFKGRHPKYKKNEMIKRMEKHVSIFNSDTRLPPTTRDFSHIPSEYMNWFICLFEKGERIPPPLVAGLLNVMQMKTQLVESTNNFEITFLREYDSQIQKYFNYNGQEAVITSDKTYIGKLDYNLNVNDGQVIFTKKYLKPIVAKIERKQLKLYDLKAKKPILTNIAAKQMMVYNNTLFVVMTNKLAEVQFIEMGDNIIPTLNAAKTRDIMPNSTKVYEGIIFNSLLGKPYLTVPFDHDKGINFLPIYVKELEGYRTPLDVKHEDGVCVIIGHKDNVYDRLTLRFSRDGTYDCRVQENVSLDFGVNFTVLANGLVISIVDDGVLEIFKKDKNNRDLKIIKDPDIHIDMLLCHDGLNVQFHRDDKLYKLVVKK